MATIDPNLKYPDIIHEHRYTDNGAGVTGAVVNKVGVSLNHVAAYRQKPVYAYSRDWAAVPNSSATTTSGMYFRFLSGCNVETLDVMIGVGVATTTLAVDPFVQVVIDPEPMAVGGQIVSDSVRYGFPSDTSPADAPNEVGWQRVQLDINPNQTYQGYVRWVGYARPFAVSAWLHGDTHAVSTSVSGVVDTTVLKSSQPILDANQEDILSASDALWRYNATPLIAWSCDRDATAPTRASTTFQNMLDSSSTTATVASPGFRIDTTYHNRYSQTTVPCEFAARAARTGGAGTDANAMKVRLVQSNTGTVLATVSGFTAIPGWRYVTVDLPVGSYKVDIQHASESSLDTITTYAASLIEVER